MDAGYSYLDFSSDTRLSGQALLFEQTSVVRPSNDRGSIAEQFARDGYVLVSNIEGVNAARWAIERLIAGVGPDDAPMYSHMAGKIQLAKLDLIPVCGDIIPRSFQALHFDMGQPILSDSAQTMYPILALYRPVGSAPSLARTRVISLEKLLAQRRFGALDIVTQRLGDYVRRFGDGWREPYPVNTLRLACFARVLDAVNGTVDLAEHISHTTGQWFSYDYSEDGLSREVAFYSRCGLDLRRVEQQINIGEGQLLIVDNMRCVHGRLGPRRPKDIYQFLYGVKCASPRTIDSFRQWLVGHLSSA